MGYGFLLTILPATALTEKVNAMRNALGASIGSFSGRNTPPHITLCFLDLPEDFQSAISEAITSGTGNQQGFTLHYDGITHFPDKHTIYIDPVEKEAIAGLRESIFAKLKADNVLHDAIRETDHPHLTIAAGLKPAKFQTAWEMLAPHELRHEERAGEVVLMKRLLRPGVRYMQVRSITLG